MPQFFSKFFFFSCRLNRDRAESPINTGFLASLLLFVVNNVKPLVEIFFSPLNSESSLLYNVVHRGRCMVNRLLDLLGLYLAYPPPRMQGPPHTTGIPAPNDREFSLFDMGSDLLHEVFARECHPVAVFSRSLIAFTF